jgi:hypothetical protein
MEYTFRLKRLGPGVSGQVAFLGITQEAMVFTCGGMFQAM